MPEGQWELRPIIMAAIATADARHGENLRRFETLERGLTELRKYIILALASLVLLVFTTIAQVAASWKAEESYHGSSRRSYTATTPETGSTAPSNFRDR